MAKIKLRLVSGMLMSLGAILAGLTAIAGAAEPESGQSMHEKVDRRTLVNFRSTHGTKVAVRQKHSIEPLACS